MKKPAIIFRPETVARLKLVTTPSDRNALTKATEQYLELSKADATTIAFLLIHASSTPDIHYKVEKSANQLGFTLHADRSFKTSLHYLPAEHAAIVGAELVYQYQLVYTDFLRVHVMAGCEKEHAELCQSIQDEPAMLFIISRSLNSCYKNQILAKAIFQHLASESDEERMNGLRDLRQSSPYLEALFPHAKHIAHLLKAMSEQHQKNTELVVQEPASIHVTRLSQPQTTMSQSIPEGLLNQVPELQALKDYIEKRTALQNFLEKHNKNLIPLYNLRRIEANLNFLMKTKDPARISFSAFMIDASFAAELKKVAQHTCGAEVDINQFVDTLQMLNTVLPAYSAMHNAFSENEKAQKGLAKAYQNVSAQTPCATTTFLAAAKSLWEATNTGIETQQKFDDAIVHFKKVYTTHFEKAE